jgi:hypothetical protein
MISKIQRTNYLNYAAVNVIAKIRFAIAKIDSKKEQLFVNVLFDYSG